MALRAVYRAAGKPIPIESPTPSVEQKADSHLSIDEAARERIDNWVNPNPLNGCSLDTVVSIKWNSQDVASQVPSTWDGETMQKIYNGDSLDSDLKTIMGGPIPAQVIAAHHADEMFEEMWGQLQEALEQLDAANALVAMAEKEKVPTPKKADSDTTLISVCFL